MSDSSASLAQSASSPFSSFSNFGQINNPSSKMSSPMLFGSTSPSTGLSGPTQASTSLFSVPSSSSESSFSASALGNSSSSLVGSAAVTLADNPSSNTPLPVGSTGLSGLQTSAGQFGPTQGYSSLTSKFGVPSPAFGSSMSAVSASPTSAFGNSSSSFGNSCNRSSMFWRRKRAFNSSDSLDTSSQPCAATTVSAFSTMNTPVTSVFGSSSTAFGVSLAPPGGSETPFQASSNSAGASKSPTFGSSTALAFGSVVSSTLAFGAPNTPRYCICSIPASSTLAFGASTPPIFGVSSTSACTFSSAPASGASSAFSFICGFTPASCQCNPSSGSTNVFPQPSGGSRLAPFIGKTEVDDTGNLESVSAMPVYKNKSPEELRWEDYQLGDKGGPAAGIGFGASVYRAPIFGATSVPFSSSPFGAPSFVNHFATTSSTTPYTFGAVSLPAFGATSTPFSSSPFGAPSSSNHFATTSSSTICSPAFGASTSPSPFNGVSSQTNGSSGQASASGAAHTLGSALNFVNTQSLLFLPVLANVVGFGYSVTPYIGQSPSTGIGHMLFTNTPLVLSPINAVALCPNHSLLLQPIIGTFTVGNSAQPPAGSNGSFSST